MMNTSCVDGDEGRLRKLILKILCWNALWNAYLVCCYFYHNIADTSRRWTDIHDAELCVVLTIVLLICVVFIAAIVTLKEKEFYMVSLTMKALYLDIFCLMYFYCKIIDLHLLTSWQNEINDMIADVPLFWRGLIEETFFMLLVTIILFPLIFKILSAFVLSFYRTKLNRSFNSLPSYNDAISQHFSPGPFHEVDLNCAEDADSPPPPYSKHPIRPSILSRCHL